MDSVCLVPESSLLCAVLDRAIRDLTDPDLVRAARVWFLCEGGGGFTFSFVCSFLGLNKGAALKGLERVKYCRTVRFQPTVLGRYAPHQEHKGHRVVGITR